MNMYQALPEFEYFSTDTIQMTETSEAQKILLPVLKT